MNDKFPQLTEKIDLADRRHHGAWEAWDFINGLVKEVYGIDIGDALALYENTRESAEGGAK